MRIVVLVVLTLVWVAFFGGIWLLVRSRGAAAGQGEGTQPL